MLNLLLIYSNERDRKKLTTFLYDNNFSIKESLHVVEPVSRVDFYPDVAILLTGVHAFGKTEAKVKQRFCSVETVFVKLPVTKSRRKAFDQEELCAFLVEKRQSKKEKLMAVFQQISNDPFSEKRNHPGSALFALELAINKKA